MGFGRLLKKVSIRSPHRSEGRLVDRRRNGATVHTFQSAPPTGVRGDFRGPGTRTYVDYVSIRSPHRSEGRLTKRFNCFRCFNPLPPPEFATLLNRFQSAPPTGVRGDAIVFKGFVKSQNMFQSAPPTGVRGDFLHQSASDASDKVSIRSPHRSEGRFSHASFISQSHVFQSAPPTGVRGDYCRQAAERNSNCDVSIRSPHRSEGRLQLLPLARFCIRSFNPLPPPE